MDYIPVDLLKYISGFSGIFSLVNVNKLYNKIFLEKCKILNQQNILSTKVIDTFLIEIKKRDFKKSNFKHFECYLFHHVSNFQEINSLHKWWLKMHPMLNTRCFINNIIYILSNISLDNSKYRESEKVLTEYIKECDKELITIE